MSYMHRWSLV